MHNQKSRLEMHSVASARVLGTLTVRQEPELDSGKHQGLLPDDSIISNNDTVLVSNEDEEVCSAATV